MSSAADMRMKMRGRSSRAAAGRKDTWKIIPYGCGKERYVEDHPAWLREGKIRGRSSRAVTGRKDAADGRESG